MNVQLGRKQALLEKQLTDYLLHRNGDEVLWASKKGCEIHGFPVGY